MGCYHCDHAAFSIVKSCSERAHNTDLDQKVGFISQGKLVIRMRFVGVSRCASAGISRLAHAARGIEPRSLGGKLVVSFAKNFAILQNARAVTNACELCRPILPRPRHLTRLVPYAALGRRVPGT